jgi:hypothetical protein
MSRQRCLGRVDRVSKSMRICGQERCVRKRGWLLERDGDVSSVEVHLTLALQISEAMTLSAQHKLSSAFLPIWARSLGLMTNAPAYRTPDREEPKALLLPFSV